MAENFKTSDSLDSVRKLINESSEILNNPNRTYKDSPLNETIIGAAGAGVGAAVSLAALSGLGVAGLSAAGITSGLAAAGAIIGGGMAAGVFVLAAPVAILGAAGVGIAAAVKRNKLKEEKQSLLYKAVEKQNAIIAALNKAQNEVSDQHQQDIDRIKTLNGMNVLLQAAINDLRSDLA